MPVVDGHDCLRFQRSDASLRLQPLDSLADPSVRWNSNLALFKVRSKLWKTEEVVHQRFDEFGCTRCPCGGELMLVI